MVPAAVFAGREIAEEGWELLVDADIPASVVTDPSVFGSTPATRLMVEKRHLDQAQQLLADLVRQDRTRSE